MTLDKENRHLLKLIRTILGKQPWQFGVVLDRDGWLSVKELQKVLHEEGVKGITEQRLTQFFDLYRPEGVEFFQGKVRTTKHDFSFDEISQALYPPDKLFIGFRQRALEHVRRSGLKETERGKGLILCTSEAMAERIIRRVTGKYYVVEVDAKEAQDKGVFFRSLGDGLFACSYLLPKWLRLPEPSNDSKKELKRDYKKEKKREDAKEDKKGRDLPGSFLLDFTSMDPPFFGEKTKRRNCKWNKKHGKWKKRK